METHAFEFGRIKTSWNLEAEACSIFYFNSPRPEFCNDVHNFDQIFADYIIGAYGCGVVLFMDSQRAIPKTRLKQSSL